MGRPGVVAPLVVVGVIAAGMLFQIRAILNPAQVGVRIDSNVGPAQSVLGTIAVLLRASLYGNRYSYPFALICYLMGVIGFFITSWVGLDTSTYKTFQLSSLLAIYGLFGVLSVVANYLKVFFGLYTVDLVTAFFAIRDNTARTQE